MAALAPEAAKSYDELAPGGEAVVLGYEPPWRRTAWPTALAAARADDVRRRVTMVGPHRDELDVVLDGLPARTHASQGEQRSLALALRLAGHRFVTDRTGSGPCCCSTTSSPSSIPSAATPPVATSRRGRRC